LLAWLDKIFSIVELIIPTTLDFYAGISVDGTFKTLKNQQQVAE
jgi:hypothetical protein